MTDDLVEGVLLGKRRSVARAISLVERGGKASQALLAALHPHTGRAHIVGVTGPPGSGKSTLVNALALHFRQEMPRQEPERQGIKVGIVAVDPTSPFSGGAILGDRIRMRDLAGDRDIFIRSMASRGSLGGLAWATADAVKVLDAAGYELVIVETVGAGQAEVNIARTAHTTVVVEVPGLGDDIQAIKAGMLEIADVFAVNKADLEGADHAVMALRMMLDLNSGSRQAVRHHGYLMDMMTAASDNSRSDEAPTWRPPIVKTVATRRDGVPELAKVIFEHQAHLEETGERAQKERERAAAELETIIQQESLRRVLTRTDPAQLAVLLDQIVGRDLDPYAASQRLLRS